MVQLVTDGNTVKLDNYDEKFNDGKWHSVVLSINTNLLVLNVDQRPAVTNRMISIITGLHYFIGGEYLDCFNSFDLRTLESTFDDLLRCLRKFDYYNFELQAEFTATKVSLAVCA